LARQRIVNIGPGVDAPIAAYKEALKAVRQENPSLARCERDGFIASDDFALLSLLVPSIAGEVSKGNYSRTDSTRCSHCGRNQILCNGKKLAHPRHVDEDSDIEGFARCIKDAAAYGSQLEALECYF